MAKISARGATELARSIITRLDPEVDGGQVNYDMVLRSDGAILRAVTWPNSTDPNLRRKTYTVHSRLRRDRTYDQWREYFFARYAPTNTEEL